MDKKRSDEWCRSLVEMVIKERNTPVDEWTNLLMGCGYYSGDNTWVLDEVGISFPPDKIILQFSGFYLSEWELETFKKAEGRSSLKRIKFLTVLDSILARYQDYDSLERSWVKNEILIQVPSIELKSRGQIKILEETINQIIPLVTDDRLPERLNDLIENKTYVIPGDNPNKYLSDDFSRKLAPADIIRKIFEAIIRLNDKYKDKSQELTLKLWVCYLFYGIPGYSLEHILKVTQRNSKTVFRSLTI